MSKSKADLNWTDVSKEPGTPHKVSPVYAMSDTLIIITNGIAVPGVYIKYNTDMNNHHDPVKKGNGRYLDMHDNKLENVTAYYRTKDLQLPEKKAEPAPAE